MKIIYLFYYIFAALFLTGAILALPERGWPILVFGIVVAVGSVFLGYKLSQFSGIARVIAMWVNVIFLFGFPIGTAFAIYSWRYFIKQKEKFKRTS